MSRTHRIPALRQTRPTRTPVHTSDRTWQTSNGPGRSSRTRPARTPWRSGTAVASERPGRTSRRCATPGRSGSTAGSPSRPRRLAANGPTSRPTPPPTGSSPARRASTATWSMPSAPHAQSWPTTTPCSPAPRASATTPRRIASSSSRSGCGCRSCSSPRAAAAGRATPTCRSSLDSTPAPSSSSPGCRGWCPRSGSPRAAASRATPRSLAAVTRSSRHATPTSAWAVRR